MDKINKKICFVLQKKKEEIIYNIIMMYIFYNIYKYKHV